MAAAMDGARVISNPIEGDVADILSLRKARLIGTRIERARVVLSGELKKAFFGVTFYI